MNHRLHNKYQTIYLFHNFISAANVVQIFDEYNIGFRKYEINNGLFSSFSDLVDVLVSLNDDHEQTTMEEQGANISKPALSVSTLQSPALNEMKKLEELKKCKKCRKNDACVVFIPCGHLISCVECADAIKRCLICKEIVKKKVRSFIS